MAAFNEIYCNGLNIIELSAKIGQESTLQVCIHLITYHSTLLSLITDSSASVTNKCFKTFGGSKRALCSFSSHCS